MSESKSTSSGFKIFPDVMKQAAAGRAANGNTAVVLAELEGERFVRGLGVEQKSGPQAPKERSLENVNTIGPDNSALPKLRP